MKSKSAVACCLMRKWIFLFETSGKIIEINFEEGSQVKKGQLLAKVNDRPLQAQLQRLVAQLKLAEDRVFRQNALLERDAVSKEAYEQVKTELATLNADIDLIEANIAQNRAPCSIRRCNRPAPSQCRNLCFPTTIVAKLTKVSPLKVEFSVPERYANDVKIGAGVNFGLEGKLETFHAKVYARESRMDQNTHTLTLRALYPNANGNVMPGRYADIRLSKMKSMMPLPFHPKLSFRKWVRTRFSFINREKPNL